MSTATFSSSSAMKKAVLKAVLLAAMTLQFMAVAVATAESQLHLGGPGGRFLVEPEGPESSADSAGGRRLLNGNFCGRGQAPNWGCRSILRHATQPACCSVRGIRWCKDLGGDDDFHCGACNRRCEWRRKCCAGKCVDRESDRNNCGRCGHRCRNNVPCQRGQCGYNGWGGRP